MFRSVGQFLSLFALLASVVNAQCAVSCSLQPVRHRSTAHACCRHHQAPKSKQQSGENACEHPTLAVDTSRLATLSNMPVVLYPTCTPDAPLIETCVVYIAQTRAPGRPFLVHFSILRI